MSTQHFLYLSSDDSLNYFPGNSHSDFYVKMLNSSIFNDVSLCGIIGFQFYDSVLVNNNPVTNNTQLNMYVCSDICQQSFVNDSMYPVLTRLSVKVNNDSTLKEIEIQNPIYIPIVQYFNQNIHLYIKGDEDSRISLLKGPTKVTLHLKSQDC